MIRVLIIDDSITQREILRQVLESDSEFAVVGEAGDGSQAVAKVEELKPDVVLMDIHMPMMDGIEATRNIMSLCPVPVVIASSSLQKRDVDHGLAALDAGAVSIIQKPTGSALLHLKNIAPELRGAIIAASQANVRRIRAARQRPLQTRTDAKAAHPTSTTPIKVVGICVSTGGPVVLGEILSAIPKPYPLPVLLVQHIADPFAEGFASWLSGKCGLTVRIATENQRLEPGVWLGRPGKHITLGSRTRIRLLENDTHEIHCPSGNPLFSSLAKYFGKAALGVQLTGMGDDGARGLLELKQAGGQTLIQDEASSLIYGMPKEAKKLGAETQQLNPAEIAAVLSKIVSETATK